MTTWSTMVIQGQYTYIMVQKVPYDSKQGLGNCFFHSDFFQHYTVRLTQPLEGVTDQTARSKLGGHLCQLYILMIFTNRIKLVP